MNRGSVLMIVVVLALASCGYLLAGARSAGRAMPSTRLAASSPAEGTTTSEQIAPQKVEISPHPEVPPEESQRLLQRTEIEDPQAVDNTLSSPPGLPLTPGRETTVAPNLSDPNPPPR